MPKPGSIVSIFAAEQAQEMGAVAGGAGGADPDDLVDPVDPLADEEQGRTPRPERSSQHGHQPAQRLRHRFLDRLGGGDRLDEAKQDGGRILGDDRVERLGGPAQRLVEAGEQARCRNGAAAARAASSTSVADPLEPEAAGGGEHIRLEAERGERQRARAPSASPPCAAQDERRSRPKRASACAAPAVPATAMRAAKPSRAQ